MRSWLFVPGDAPRKLDKASGSGADVVILDLEDSVAPGSKQVARDTVAAYLSDADRTAGPCLYVRTNALDSGHAEADLDAVIPAAPDGILLPKCESGTMASTAAAMIAAREGEHGLGPGATALAVIATETAASLFAMGSYRDDGPVLAALTWGLEDLSADLQIDTVRGSNGRPTGPFALARTLALVAARAAGTEPIDGVFTAFRDADGLARECAEAARDGFTGKLAIHPDQVETINAAFTPTPEALGRARAIVNAFAADPGTGVIGLDGEMIDRPHLMRAEKLLTRAARLGLAGV